MVLLRMDMIMINILMTQQNKGGRGAHIEEVPSAENQAAGRDLGNFYRENDIKPGDTFDIELIE
jgi:hypothetical protein